LDGRRPRRPPMRMPLISVRADSRSKRMRRFSAG
jgi:hypothetical protein